VSVDTIIDSPLPITLHMVISFINQR